MGKTNRRNFIKKSATFGTFLILGTRGVRTRGGVEQPASHCGLRRKWPWW